MNTYNMGNYSDNMYGGVGSSRIYTLIRPFQAY